MWLSPDTALTPGALWHFFPAEITQVASSPAFRTPAQAVFLSRGSRRRPGEPQQGHGVRVLQGAVGTATLTQPQPRGDIGPCTKSLHKPTQQPEDPRWLLATSQSTRSGCSRDTARMESRPRSWEIQIWEDRAQGNLVNHQETSARPEHNPCLYADARFGRDCAVLPAVQSVTAVGSTRPTATRKVQGLLLSLPHQPRAALRSSSSSYPNTG